uniref:BZIP domain-containing protein n=1 Tax=Amphora coffeiformis TaxID=265554 RepID=A0A7S3LAG9_9STRA
MSSITTTIPSLAAPSTKGVPEVAAAHHKDEDGEAHYIRQKTKKTLKKLLKEMEQVLGSLDEAEKRAYETAQGMVPHLVATEAPLEGFLCTEDYHPAKAAKRCASYWHFRREVFGNERWLLPMTQTGAGALTEPDIQFIRTGWIQAYPAGDDEFLVVADMSKLTNMALYAEANGLDLNVMYDRCTIYMGTIMGRDATAKMQRMGVTTIHIVNSDPRPPMHLRQQAWDIGLLALPMKVKRTLVVQAYEFGKEELLDFMRTRTASAIIYNCNGRQQQQIVEEVHGNSVNTTVQHLSVRGIPQAYLPVALGGGVHLDAQFANWMRAQISLEEFTISPVSTMMRRTTVRPENANRSSAKSAPCTLVPTMKKTKGKLLIQRNDEREETFCKKRNALYSRRLYHKRKLEILSLQGEIKKLEASNKKLKTEQQHLQGLCVQAQILLNLHSTGEIFPQATTNEMVSLASWPQACCVSKGTPPPLETVVVQQLRTIANIASGSCRNETGGLMSFPACFLARSNPSEQVSASPESTSLHPSMPPSIHATIMGQEMEENTSEEDMGGFLPPDWL